jgi:hypothetical protein
MVYLTNLSFDMDWKQLKDHIKEIAEVRFVLLLGWIQCVNFVLLNRIRPLFSNLLDSNFLVLVSGVFCGDLEDS